MIKEATAVYEELKKGQYAPVYFLQGEEAFYIDLISNYIEANAIDESQKGFNQTIMYGRDADVNVIMQNAKRFPMMADRQVVIVKEAQDIKDLEKGTGEKLMLDYLKSPAPTTILVFCYKNKTLDGRKALSKAFEQNAVLVNSKKLYDNKVPAWIQDYVKGKGFKIADKAVAMLCDAAGNELSKISNEIDKILINFKDPIEISPEHIQKYVGVSKDYNYFELQNALIRKEVVKCIKIVHYFENNPKSNPAIVVISSMFGFFTKLIQAHTAQDKSERGVAAVLKINPFFAKDYVLAMRNYPLGKVVTIIHALREADLKSKGITGGTNTEGQIIKELVLKILHA